MKEPGGLQVLLVDDHAIVRKGIRSMLESYGDIQVVGEASNGIEAIKLMEQLHPNIVLMDINMPKMDGVEATAQIMSGYPDTIIIGLSANATPDNQEAMTRAGAVRLIPKEQASDLLYDAIHATVQSREPSKGPRSMGTQVREE
jgi:DNA-binding NarL/FixJ family response regulator